MNEPDFTIITPSYNYGHYIGECLDSVKNQKGATYEHLVIDGGSTDSTGEVVKAYPHADFTQEPDQGMSDAINKGFKRAKGKWVMWLNADDRLLEGALSSVKHHSDLHQDADIIYGGWNFINGDGQFQRRMTIFPYSQGIMLYTGCYIGSTSTFLRRSSVIDQGLLLDINFKYVMDGEYYSRLFSLGKKFSYLPKVLAEFRWHDGNLSRKNYHTSDAGSWLRLQKQFAETRAFRRAYGKVFFRDENLLNISDGILYIYYRILKFFLKQFYLTKIQK